MKSVPPFDTTACHGASLEDLSRKRIDWFLEVARRERSFPIKANISTKALLAHLNLLDGVKPTNAAMLLFGLKPQRFHRTAETKCVQCHGTVYQRPFASQQIYTGDLFAQVDEACDFVLRKIERTVGTRETGPTAPTRYDLPPEVIAEAIVNAITHRDYNSNASVEIRLFADRLEVWNPGTLPGTLTLESLHEDHPSVPFNPLIAESLYLSRYIEKAGSGTQRMIELCRETGLPEPDYELRQGSFVITIWKDWLTAETLHRMGLNERQLKAIGFLKQQGWISNADYQRITGAIKKTATRDLHDMQNRKIVERHGQRGPGVRYVLSTNRDKKGTMGT